MGFGDKFKDLRKQAQEAVAEHKQEIHNAVDVVSAAADEKTKGKYTDKIAKFNQKAAGAVDKAAATDAEGGAADADATNGAADAGTKAEEPSAAAAQAPPSSPAPTGPPPAFDE